MQPNAFVMSDEIIRWECLEVAVCTHRSLATPIQISFMQARLEVVRGAKTKEILLKLPAVIGRGGNARVKLPASTVSRHHCEVYEFEGQIAIRDLGSANGTAVNGHRIQGPTFLTPEDEVTIGPLTARLHCVASSNAPTKDLSQPIAQTDSANMAHATPSDVAACDTADQQEVSLEEIPLEEIPLEEIPLEEVTPVLEEVLPSFEEIPEETAEPVVAQLADAEVVTDLEPVESDDASVLQYNEAAEESGRSFVSITPAEGQPEAASELPVFDGEEADQDNVKADDTSLNQFFKNLDG